MSDYVYYKALSSNLKDFLLRTNSLFKRLNKNGFVILNMSLETKKLITDYGTSNIYKVIQDKKLWNGVVKEDQNEYSKIRYSTFFIDIDSIKEALGDKHHNLVKIILSLQSDLSRIFDIRNNKNYAEAITILYSLKSSSDIQGLHTDYDTKIEIGEKNYPLSCIFALQDNTHFRYLSKSHKLNNGGGKMLEKLITLNFGQFILFHPFLIHSGWFFKGRSNLRIHFYIDDRAIFDRIKETKERYNETYFIDIDRKRQPSFYFETKELHKMKGLLSLKRVKKNNIKKNLSKV